MAVVLAAVCVSGCERPVPVPPEAVAQAAAEPRERTLQRNENYRDYELIALSGPSISGSEFENKFMCKDVFQNADVGIGMLKYLVIIPNSNPDSKDINKFLAISEGQPTEVIIIYSQSGGDRIPAFIMMGTEVIADCSS
ncbi:hypothetical protein [Phenylobacterium ferrooxidans]|uniref:Lipoprotein n=1 Tax=Phenylobacterium ferrooxidans TaxID=2982689 RepID=A0ABW6CQY1_9CAUL